LPYSIAEIIISLCTMAIFVNSAILIVAGAALYNPENPQVNSDLFAIHDLLVTQLGNAAGILFALALLFSGESSSIIATIVGQTITEGFFYNKWHMKPWIRRLFTRCIAIIPCLAVAGAVGKTGLGEALNGSQVALSVLLPIVSFPLIHLTSSKKIMRVRINVDENNELSPRQSSPIPNTSLDGDDDAPLGTSRYKMTVEGEAEYVDMSNHIVTTILAWFIWLMVTGFDAYLIVKAAMGESG